MLPLNWKATPLVPLDAAPTLVAPVPLDQTPASVPEVLTATFSQAEPLKRSAAPFSPVAMMSLAELPWIDQSAALVVVTVDHEFPLNRTISPADVTAYTFVALVPHIA